jgi:branched-chain amino acid transport system permease protein
MSGGGLNNGQWVTRRMVVFFVILLTMPLWSKSVGLYQYLGVEIVIWMIFALGFNLLLGYTGLPSFGHGAYFGVGAYAFGLFNLNVSSIVWLGVLAAVVASLVAGALVACFISHRRGIYFALMTIAFGQVFWFIAMKWHSVTGGEDGLLNIHRPTVDLLVTDISLKDNVSL